MLSSHQLEQNCARDYRRYSDTVAVCSAVYYLSTKNPEIVKFVGIEHNLQNSQGKTVTPDIAGTFDNDCKGVVLELKWSLPLPDELLEKEIIELGKYLVPLSNWRKPSDSVDFQDLILVCHIDDAQRVIDMAKKLSNEPNHAFLSKEGFAVWSWTITPPKHGERKEELRLFSVYGKTRNEKIEGLIGQAGGYLVPEDILTFLRFTFTFIKEKPPIPYTMTILIQNIFTSFQRSPEKELYDIHTDAIYERAKSFFPSWHEYDAVTIQIKRRWLREALEKLCELGLSERPSNQPDLWKITLPFPRTRKPIQHVLCRKLVRQYLKQQQKQKGKRSQAKPSRPKAAKEDQKITKFLK